MPGGNQDFPFRIEVTYGDGDTKAYFTHSLATDVENVVSASIMNGKIDNMPQATIIGDSGSAVSGGYLTQETNGPIPLGGRTTGMFGDHDVGVNSALSISFDDPATGSLTFHDTETTDKGGLASYQFFGTKVCSVLGVPEAIPIRTENFKLSDDSTDTSNYISGDIISDSIAIKEGFKMSPQARMKSNMVWDTENGEGLTQWVSGSSVLLQMGISGSTSNTKLSGDGNLQITGVDELTFGGGTGKIIGADTLQDTELIFDASADVTIVSGRTSYDETVYDKGQLKIDAGGGNVLTGQLRILDTESTTFGTTMTYGDFTLMLKNLHGNAVGDFAGIGFDVGTELDSDAIAGAIAVLRDNTTSTKHDGNMVFATNDDADDDLTERMRITHNGLVLIGRTSEAATSKDPLLEVDGFISCDGIVDRAGTGGSDNGDNIINFNWNGSQLEGWVDTTEVLTQITSDYRIKENVNTITGSFNDVSSSIQKINQLRPITYTQASASVYPQITGSIKTSFIAHEMAEVLPTIVKGEKDELYEDGLPKFQKYSNEELVVHLVKSVQELTEAHNHLITQITGSTDLNQLKASVTSSLI